MDNPARRKTTRLNFNCREQKLLRSMDPLPLMFFNTAHELTGDILKSRWTIGLPSELNGRSRLTAKISNRVRIADVMLEDRRPVKWQVTEENGQQILSLLLPEAADSATLNISAASVLPQTESWDLPMLSMGQWFSPDDTLRGPILVPIGQISVVLPRAVYLDEWTLVGIQEHDIVTKLDQSRDYQLIQFQPEASAIARTSSSEPQLSDSVVTLVEPQEDSQQFLDVWSMWHVKASEHRLSNCNGRYLRAGRSLRLDTHRIPDRCSSNFLRVTWEPPLRYSHCTCPNHWNPEHRGSLKSNCVSLMPLMPERSTCHSVKTNSSSVRIQSSCFLQL